MKVTVELKELRQKDNKSLVKLLEETNKKVTEIRFQASFWKVKNYKEISVQKKKAARIWTILSERMIEELEKEENAKQK